MLQGITELPSEEDMWAQVARQHEFNRRSFTQVERHALMVRSAQALTSSPYVRSARPVICEVPACHVAYA